MVSGGREVVEYILDIEVLGWVTVGGITVVLFEEVVAGVAIVGTSFVVPCVVLREIVEILAARDVACVVGGMVEGVLVATGSGVLATVADFGVVVVDDVVSNIVTLGDDGVVLTVPL